VMEATWLESNTAAMLGHSHVRAVQVPAEYMRSEAHPLALALPPEHCPQRTRSMKPQSGELMYNRAIQLIQI